MKSVILKIFLILSCSGCFVYSQILDSSGVRLNLKEVIALNFENSRTIKNYYLSLKSQKQELYTQEGKFIPVFTVGANAGSGQDNSKNGDVFVKTFSNQLGISANASIKVPTGASISYTWEGTGFKTTSNVGDEGDISKDFLKQGGTLSITQPILKGGWYDINMASVNMARLSDSINILTLKSSLIDNVTTLIRYYRSLFLAEKQLEIAEISLKTAKGLDTLNRELAKTGIIAQNETIQNETQVAYAEIQTLQARNYVENARLSLINWLDIDSKFPLLAKEEEASDLTKIDTGIIFQMALKNNPTYLSALYALKMAEIRYQLAKDNKKIDLSLFANYFNSTNGYTPYQLQNKWQFGISLSYVFNDLTRDQLYEQSLIALDQAENNLIKAEQTIRVQLTNSLKDLNLKYIQMSMAKKLKSLSEKKLELEKEKIKIGKSSTFQIISFQNDLVSSQNSEINAIVAYLNSLSELDQIIGTTLDTYGIKLDIESRIYNQLK